MLLTVDVGNTNIVAGIMDGDQVLFAERIKTDTSKTDLEYVVLFQAILNLHNVDKAQISGAIISSVVPPLNQILIDAIEMYTGVKPLLVGPGVKTGINIAIDNPSSAGSDLIVGAVAGLHDYGAPLIMIDMGTATTVTVLDKTKNFVGGMIIPGVRSSLDSLVTKTSQLPRISLEAPKKIIGKNTVDCMKSGIIIGQAASIDGIIDRMFEELGYEAKVVATGGLVPCIIPNCKHEIIMDEYMLLRGLKYIYDKNTEE